MPALLVLEVDRVLLIVRTGDLLPAVEFMAAVIVQGQHAGQRAARPSRFQQYRLRARAVGQLPREFLHLHAVIFVLALYPALRRPARVRHRHPLAKSLARRRPPGRRVGPMGVAEGEKIGAFTGQGCCPRAVGAEHRVRGHTVGFLVQ